MDPRKGGGRGKNKIGPRGIPRCALSESPEPDPGWVDVT